MTYRKPGTTERGYDYTHRKARQQAIARMPEGAPCARCGQPMSKTNPRDLHYDHTDDRTGYLGLSHARCNTLAGASRGGQVTAARHGRRWPQRRPQWHSRAW